MVHNFGAGPAKIPQEVLRKAQEGILCFKNTGMSVMEMSHRSKDFSSILKECSDGLRGLMEIPVNYHILFLQGGATNQFSAIPLNLIADINDNVKVDYIVTGVWSEKSCEEASAILGEEKVNVVFSSGKTNHDGRILIDDFKYSSNPAYIYYCDNETVHGVEWTNGVLPPIPERLRNVPVVMDMSSSILSKPINVNNYGIIFAGAQKNVGPSGLTIVIIRDDLLNLHRSKLHKHHIPIMLNYLPAVENNSCYNTPPTFAIYVASLNFEWLQKKGGIQWVNELNDKKSKLVYDCIQSSNGFYVGHVKNETFASRMNVTFRIFFGGKPSAELEKKFLEGAERKSMFQLAGHRSVGGLRASLYNSVEVESAEMLVEFMKEFMLAQKN
jgi:phosphoserine aminotransferase